MSKQDRQGARTPADLERKYSFGKSFAEVMGLAKDAQDAAEKAQTTAGEAKTEISRLANSIELSVTGGEPGNKASIILRVGDKEYSGEINLTGMVTFGSLENEGETVINGSNITAGKIQSSDGKITIDLSGSLAEFFGGLITNGLYVKGSASGDVPLLSVGAPRGPAGKPYLYMVFRSAIGKVIGIISESFRSDTNEHYGSHFTMKSHSGNLEASLDADDDRASLSLHNNTTGTGRNVASINEAGVTSLWADRLLGRKASWVYLSSIGRTVLIADEEETT